MANTQTPALTVSQLTRRIKSSLEQDQGFQRLQVEGEISNLTVHGSGHVYFSLKDEGAQITCVMFRSAYNGTFPYAAGDQVRAAGSLTVYAPRGNYQLQVRSLKPLGQGDLYQRFIALKEQLMLEGLFDTAHKRELPRMPRHIAVITSPTGAVIRDIQNTLARRFPHVRVSLIPAQVQGTQAVASLIHAFAVLDALPQVDVAILARGGGSIEDLWCFNDEGLAHAIFQAPVPVISAVGHETDFTIADFVADVRAPTPTAAAELATPLAAELRMQLDERHDMLHTLMQRRMDDEHQWLDDLAFRMSVALQQPVHTGRTQVAALRADIRTAMREQLTRHRMQLADMDTQLQRADIHTLLQDGFSVTLHKGKRLRNTTDIAPGDTLETRLADGSVHSQVLPHKLPPHA